MRRGRGMEREVGGRERMDEKEKEKKDGVRMGRWEERRIRGREQWRGKGGRERGRRRSERGRVQWEIS